MTVPRQDYRAGNDGGPWRYNRDRKKSGMHAIQSRQERMIIFWHYNRSGKGGHRVDRYNLRQKMEACTDNTPELVGGECNTLLLVEKDGNM